MAQEPFIDKLKRFQHSVITEGHSLMEERIDDPDYRIIQQCYDRLVNGSLPNLISKIEAGSVDV